MYSDWIYYQGGVDAGEVPTVSKEQFVDSADISNIEDMSLVVP
jgi:hypothetical protein